MEREGKKEREKKREREIFYPMVYSSVDNKGWSWAAPRLGAETFFQIFHVGAGTQVPDHLPTFFSRKIIRNLGWNWSSLDLNVCSYGMMALHTPLLHDATP